MALVYSTILDLYGPWLLDETALTHLDDVLIPEWQRLCAIRQEAIEADLRIRENEYRQRKNGCEPDDQELRYFRERATDSAGPKSLRMMLRLKGASSVVVKSFREALRSAELVDHVPIGLDLKLDCGSVRASLEIGTYSDRLRLTTSPESSQDARELFVLLRNWAVTHQPPWWQRLWGRLHGLQWLIWVAILMVVNQFLPSGTEGVEQLVRSRAQALLQDGLSQEEVLQAVELLLISTAKWAPNVKSVVFPAWFKVVFFGGLAASVMLSIRPKVIIGVGRGRQLVERWRRWMNFVGVTIPGLVFGSFIWPWLNERITEWLK